MDGIVGVFNISDSYDSWYIISVAIGVVQSILVY